MATRAKAPAPRLGIHIRTAAGLVAGARHAVETGCSTFQIMSGNPSAWNPGSLDPVQALKFREFLNSHDLRPVFLHAGYLINLSCPRGRNAPIYAKSITLLKATLERTLALSCEFVVIHLGSRRGISADEAISALTGGLSRLADGSVLPERWPVLLLENSAGSGDSVGSSLDELALVLEEAARSGVRQPLGICLDTAHLWGAGYDLTSPSSVNHLVEEISDTVGLERLHLIHVNDSPVERGSRKDRHEHPGVGIIPLPALKAILRHPRLGHVAMILETPGSTHPSDGRRMEDLKRLAGRL